MESDHFQTCDQSRAVNDYVNVNVNVQLNVRVARRSGVDAAGFIQAAHEADVDVAVVTG
jgi:hypothetical protein